MPYATVAEFAGSGGYLTQLDPSDFEIEDRATAVLARAEAIVDGYLNFSFTGYTTEERTIRAQYGPWFVLPPHDIGSVTNVTTLSGDAITDFTENDRGILYASDPDFGYEHDWNRGQYKVTADWGYGNVTEDVKQVVLELAVNIWRSADSGHFTDVVGASDGGQAGYEGALTKRQKMVLDNARWQRIPQPI